MNLLRYLVVGGCAAAIDFALFTTAVIWLAVPWFPAAAGSFLVATAVNYILSINFVFESGVRFAKSSEWAVVLAVSGWGLVLNQAVLWALIEVGAIHVLVAKVIATGCVFGWNYGMRRYYVFAQRGRR